ncbi:MAG: hypothetical protein LQ340_006008 [Diploschistes diacapsis]|nr:MAG: hypothetical protein LQ340_006008 [Diploschistes diacapsis]
MNGNAKNATKPEGPSREFSGTVKVSQRPPSKMDLEKVAELPVLDSNGKSRTFKYLYSDPEHAGHRTLIIFIRHFFCGVRPSFLPSQALEHHNNSTNKVPPQNCQEYLRTLCSSISPSSLSSLPTPTSIVVVGCGSPDLIPFYASASSCHFPVYADSTRALYEQLHMISTKSLGPKRPAYQQRSLISISLESIYQGLSRGRQAFKGGDFWQVGGEFLIEREEVRWCHRMTSTRDHTEVPELRRVLGLDDAGPPPRPKRWSMGPGVVLGLGSGSGNGGEGLHSGSGGMKRSLSLRSRSWRRGGSRSTERKRSAEKVLVERQGEKENLADGTEGPGATEVEGAKA